MNNYYQWLNDFSFPSPSEIIIPDEWKEYDLFGSQKIPKNLPPIQLSFENEKKLSDSIPSRKILLFFSKRLVNFLEENYPTKLFQTFPVELKGLAVKVEEYYLINILNTQDVIDRERSKLKTDKYGDILRIESLEITGDEFANNDFFRLEGFSSLLICSGLFVEKLKAGKFYGMKFTPISKLFI